jgi:flagellar basal-body rod protein FlgF
MQSSLYVSLSGQLALERRMETLARNLANMNTVGYRADGVTFEAVMAQTGRDSVAFATAGETFISRRAGGLTKTESPLDVAVDGEAWFAFQTPRGLVYTRDGRMTMDANGELRNVGGHPIVDPAGAPIQLNPTGGAPVVSRDGVISQDGQQAGVIGLFTIAPEAKLSRFENSGVVPDRRAEPVVDFARNGVVQGFVEGSNVNPVLEMSRLIMVTRAFESATAAVNEAAQAQQEATRTLGDPR